MRPRNLARAAFGLVLAVALLLGWRLWAQPDVGPEEAPREERAELQALPVPVSPPVSVRAAPVPLARTETSSAPAAELPLDADDERVEPHPLTRERSSLAPPWGMFDEVSAAFKARDFERGRELLERLRGADPKAADWQDYYQGLEIIGACLESPDHAARLRADAFIAEYRASPLRRHVRRKCRQAR